MEIRHEVDNHIHGLRSKQRGVLPIYSQEIVEEALPDLIERKTGLARAHSER
jgi:hypothetical protein